MGIIKDSVYALDVAAIRGYKLCELGVLTIFRAFLQRQFISKAESIGLIFHLPGEPTTKLSVEAEQRILKKCGYDKICYVKINNLRYFPRLANTGGKAMGEGYMNGDWEVDGPEWITEFFKRVLEQNMSDFYFTPWNKFLNYMELEAFNLQTVGKAFEVAKKHYDLGNDLFESFLDPWMQYTCGYWAKADNLNDAQIAKMDLIARKLDLKPGMRVLDVGCGWGGLCKYLAQNYGVECVGITVGEEGVKYAQEKCKGLPVEFRVQDYRKVDEQFDRIVSVGMFEAVGSHNFRKYFEVLHKCLKDDGIFLLHTIGVNHKNFMLTEAFSHHYIFPNGQFPYIRDITRTTEGLFIIEDWHNFGLDYFKTITAWRDNFMQSWPKLQEKYGERFYRMWLFYLSTAASLFQARKAHLWQIAFSKDGLRREYRAAR